MPLCQAERLGRQSDESDLWKAHVCTLEEPQTLADTLKQVNSANEEGQLHGICPLWFSFPTLFLIQQTSPLFHIIQSFRERSLVEYF